MGFQNFLWVMIGSALGGAARFWGSVAVANRFGETFPWGRSSSTCWAAS
jgi:CrcB protein